MPPRRFAVVTSLALACTPASSQDAGSTAQPGPERSVAPAPEGDARTQLLGLIPDRADSVVAVKMKSFFRGRLYADLLRAFSRDAAFLRAIGTLRACGLSPESVEAVVFARHGPSRELGVALRWPGAGTEAGVRCLLDAARTVEPDAKIVARGAAGDETKTGENYLLGAGRDTVVFATGAMATEIERCIAGTCTRAQDGRLRDALRQLPEAREAWFAATSDGGLPDGASGFRDAVQHVRAALDLTEQAEVQSWIVASTAENAEGLRKWIHLADAAGMDGGWQGEVREVEVAENVVVVRSVLPLGAIVEAEVAELNTASDAADMMEQWSDRVCACTDLDCVRGVQDDQEAWIAEHGDELTGTQEVADRIAAATERMTRCLEGMMRESPP